MGALARDLSRLPKDLPYIIIKGPNEKITDQTFRVRRDFLIEALEWLKLNHPDYQHISISHANADLYPTDDIFQALPELDPTSLKMPREAPSAANEESVFEDASTVQSPAAVGPVLEGIIKHFQLPWPQREEKPASEFMPGFSPKHFQIFFQIAKGT